MGRHDLTYRLLFAQPRMIEELVRHFVGEAWTKKLDFSTLERVNASFVSEKLKSREGDIIWKLRRKDGRPVFIYLLVEFQSRVERFMAVRVVTYVGLLYQHLIAQKEISPEGLLPLVIPIVLYNGGRRWWASQELAELIELVDSEAQAYVPRLRYRVIDEGRYTPEELRERHSAAAVLFWLEKNRDREAVRQGIRWLLKLLKDPRDIPLRGAFFTWLECMLLPGSEIPDEIPEIRDLQEFETMLEKTVKEWNRQLREEGRRIGRREGRREGEAALLALLGRQLEQKFGPLDEPTRVRLRAADSDELVAWGDRLLKAQRLPDVFGD